MSSKGKKPAVKTSVKPKKGVTTKTLLKEAHRNGRTKKLVKDGELTAAGKKVEPSRDPQKLGKLSERISKPPPQPTPEQIAADNSRAAIDATKAEAEAAGIATQNPEYVPGGRKFAVTGTFGTGKSKTGVAHGAGAGAPSGNGGPKPERTKRVSRSEYLDRVVTVLAKENPKREGSTQHKYFAALKTGETVKQAVDRGLDPVMIPGWVSKGWISLK